jgi:putative component of membrane protein insertase Oxa1/YidC/SpoIIIJ protein YidD
MDAGLSILTGLQCIFIPHVSWYMSEIIVKSKVTVILYFLLKNLLKK